MSVKSDLMDLIEENFAVSKESLDENTDLCKIGIDKYSTDFVDLLISIENKFEIEVSNDDFLKTNTLKEIIQLVEKCIKESKSNDKK